MSKKTDGNTVVQEDPPARDLAAELTGHADALRSTLLGPLTEWRRSAQALIAQCEPALQAAHQAAEAEWGAETRGYNTALSSPVFNCIPGLAGRLRTARDVVAGALESLQAVPSLIEKAHRTVAVLTLEELKTTRRGELVALSLKQAEDHAHNWSAAIRDVRWHVDRVRKFLAQHPEVITASGYRELEKPHPVQTRAITEPSHVRY